MRRLMSIGILLGYWCGIARAADAASVRDVIALVRSAIGRHDADKSTAKSLRKLTLGEKLDLRTMEELESEGAGPESLAAMDFLIEQSANKPASTELPHFASPARPSIEEQKAFFRKINVNAIHYSATLPDFICTEVVHRYQMTPPRGMGATRRNPFPPSISEGSWFLKDVLTVKLSYFDNHEKYELTLVNGHKTRETYESSGGAISEGDFGSVLLEIFAPQTRTVFQWDHWTHLRKRLTRVYAYRTARETSHYRIGVGDGMAERKMVVAGRRGFVYADDETGMVMRIVGEAESIPTGFPVLAQSSMQDYGYAAVGDKQYLLPLRVQNGMKTARISFKNVLEFRDYRKFTGESSISFDGPDVVPK